MSAFACFAGIPICFANSVVGLKFVQKLYELKGISQ